MDRPLDQQIRERLDDYLTGTVALQSFKLWLSETTWNVSEMTDPTAHALASEIKLALAERSGGFLNDDEVRLRLAAIGGIGQRSRVAI